MAVVLSAERDRETRRARGASRPGLVLFNDDRALRSCWHPVARSAEITGSPIKVWLLAEPLVLFRVENEVVGFVDRCPHRRAPLSEGSVAAGILSCTYHGWSFDGSGECVAIPSLGPLGPTPAKANLEPLRVAERYGMVFVALDDPLVDLPEIAAFAGGGSHVALEPYEGRYGSALLIDNQLDLAHFAFVHAATFGRADDPSTPAYGVERDGWGFTAKMEMPITASNDPGVTDGVRPLHQHREMHYRYLAPFHVELTLTYPVMGGSTTVVFFAAPMSRDRSRFYVDLFFVRDEPFSDAELAERVAFERRVIGEDLALQATFDTIELPLGRTAECHVRADRASLEFRRILAELVEAAR